MRIVINIFVSRVAKDCHKGNKNIHNYPKEYVHPHSHNCNQWNSVLHLAHHLGVRHKSPVVNEQPYIPQYFLLKSFEVV